VNGILEVHGLSRSFGGLQVNRDISFCLAAGDRVGLIGPNGAGKTTLINLISGALQPTSGRIVFDGQDVSRLDAAQRARRGLVRTFQISRLFSSLTVSANVALAIMQRRHLTWRCFSVAENAAGVRPECDDLLQVLGISHLADLPVTTLAYGPQRLVEIAIGLALNPKVLLLDEPAAGVPSGEAPKIFKAIDRLPPDVAVLLIEHDMELVFRFAKRVLVLAGGQLIFAGAPEVATADAAVRHAYLGNYANASCSR
jgi:branched-chain amino acid transport system ATP-binding protein